MRFLFQTAEKATGNAGQTFKAWALPLWRGVALR
jgi:hypothetical protein